MKLLLAEDEKEMARALTAILEHSGYEVDAVPDGEAAVKKAAEEAYDGMIFDIMMPKKDGIEALREIRAAGDVTPVIMLTAKTEIRDRITGLDAGADDYLTKPFAMGELLARLRSMTKRNSTFAPKTLTFGCISLDMAEQELTGKSSVRLAGKESKLMEFLLQNPDKNLSTADIFRRVWGDEPAADPGIVWMYVSYLRQKLQAISADVEISGEEGGNFCLRKKS